MLDRLDKIDNKLDKIDDSLVEHTRILARQEAHLAEHIRRTALAEENLEAIRASIKPIQKHVSMLEGVLKFIGGGAILGTGFLEILKHLKILN